MQEVKIEKLVHGGQGLGTLPDGRKVFVWNALPGETVLVRLLKGKKSYAEGIADEIVLPSKDRIAPLEPESYLATSPWQIMTIKAENKAKQGILREAFEREGVELPDRLSFDMFGSEFGYRNKMEFGFWGDDEGIHAAHFVRGSHGKVKVRGSALAMEPINKALEALIAQLNTLTIRAGDLKAVILRCDQAGNTVAALFVKPASFPKLTLPKELQGLVVYHSNPKSPASVPTKLLQELGERGLQDVVYGARVQYDVLSFFQVNVPIFSHVISMMFSKVGDLPKIDMYSGVGSIGVALKGTEALVELDEANVAMAKRNVGNRPITVYHAAAEKALEYIAHDKVLIVDPPRAGLHDAVTEKISEILPPYVLYLSCNPSTQARDVKRLIAAGYQLVHISGYNFFPRTPHIESLVVLMRKGLK